MCGITGYINTKEGIDLPIIQTMTDALQHRGPDGQGIYISVDEHVSLGHRRLSFLDLSESGKQPMHHSSKNIVITFNGEIYNYQELRDELNSQYTFQSNTDTEVILAGYEKWGTKILDKLNGMFAFAIYDEGKNQLFVARDRFGVKPFYYTITEGKMLFASELKAIIASNLVQKKIELSAISDYFVYRYIPSPKTIWQGIKKLPPAHFALIDCATLALELTEYWTLTAKNHKDSEQVKKVEHLLEHSIKQQTYADVPVGSFLSGGYDSSALVYFMKKLKQNPPTFSIGFSKWEKSEDQFAKIVANHLDVDNEAVIADKESLNWVDKMYKVYDEPIADISIVPTYLVSKLARTRVKAVVSGEGADEIFGGYTWQHEYYNLSYPKNPLDKLKCKIFKKDPVEYYANAMAMGWFDENELKQLLHPSLHASIPKDVHWFYRQHHKSSLSPLKSIQYMDMKCFMGELVLTKVDRASMANSLEVRVPFLDHQLFEYVFSLNEKEYFQPKQTKYLLYKTIEGALPASILERKKQGFVGPDSYYMNLEWYKKELENSKLVELKIVNRAYIDQLLKEQYNWKLWKILILEKWIKKWVDC